MKKYLLYLSLFSFGILFCSSQNVFSQFERIEIKYTVEEVVKGNDISYNINVKVQDLTGKVTYTLYKDEPLLENVVSKSDETLETSHQFENVSLGKYYLIVFESEKKAGLETIIIENSKSSQQ